MKILVIYYSRTGHTRKVAKAIAAACVADIVPIRDMHSQAGALGYLRSGFEAMFKRPGRIQPIDKDPARYDLVILGTPIWMLHITNTGYTALIYSVLPISILAIKKSWILCNKASDDSICDH